MSHPSIDFHFPLGWTRSFRLDYRHPSLSDWTSDPVSGQGWGRWTEPVSTIHTSLSEINLFCYSFGSGVVKTGSLSGSNRFHYLHLRVYNDNWDDWHFLLLERIKFPSRHTSFVDVFFRLRVRSRSPSPSTVFRVGGLTLRVGETPSSTYEIPYYVVQTVPGPVVRTRRTLWLGGPPSTRR